MIGAGESLALAWARLLLEELWRLGLRDVCLAPGSRSAPLTLAAARHGRLRCHLHFDERGLGFMALGLARQSGRPVAVITTSGTAVANLYPAVVEARMNEVPLIVLSADRPVELIDCGANQAIPQTGIFAGYPVFAQHLPAPALSISPRYLLGSVDQLWDAVQQTPGPAHLNCPFAEPFYPGEAPPLPADWLNDVASWQQSEQPLTPLVRPVSAVSLPADWPALASRRGVIIAGLITDPAAADSVAALATHLGWPLLADAQSQLRQHPAALAIPELGLVSPTTAAALAQAEVCLQIGGRLIGKALGRWLEGHGWADHWLLDPHARRLSPGYRPQRQLVAAVGDWCAAARAAVPSQTSWYPLAEVHQRLYRQLQPALQAWSELAITHALSLHWQGTLMLGNSLPPRLWQTLAAPRELSPDQPPRRLLANRGASGIDGLIATAAGMARAAGRTAPLTLLLGDTSALHDLNSLALLRAPHPPLVIVLLNNDGGGIFSLLPAAAAQPEHEACFQLPHGLDFQHAAAQFALAYQAPTSVEAFVAAYQAACQASVSTLIECRVPAGDTATRLAALTAAIRSAEIRP